MKLNSLIGHTRKPDIKFSRSDGKIDLSSRVAAALHLEDGDVIDIARQGGEFLLYIRYKAAEAQGKHICAAHPSNRLFNTKHYRIYSRVLANIFFDMARDPEAEVLRYPCGEVYVQDEKTVIPIITRCPL